MSEEEFVRDELFSDSASPADVSASTDAPEEAVLDAEATEDEAAPADVADADAPDTSMPELNIDSADDAPTEEPSVEDAPADSPDAEDAPAEDDEEESAEDTVRKRIRGLPGEWYVLHTYAGYEKRVKQDLEHRIHTLNMEDYIFEIQVPMEQVYEVKKGQRKLVSRVRMPGYAIVRMEMTDDSWRAVQDTNGVTGFVGNGRDAVALTHREVVDMLTPIVEQEVAEAAKAAGKPVATDAAVTLVDYEVGETVTLTTEPWVGMPATISQVDAANQRLTVLMTLVGQETPVDLSFSQIKKMD